MFALVSALALSSFAHAHNPGQISCHSTQVVDAGYSFALANDYRTAELEEMSMHGSELISRMECEHLAVPMIYPQPLSNTVVCRDPSGGDGSLIVRLFEGGPDFQRHAEVKKLVVRPGHVFEVPVQFGKLACTR